MGTLATTRLVYGNADVIENGKLDDGSIMSGSVDYNYNNANGDTDMDTETESVSESTTTTTTTTTSVTAPKMAKAKFDVIPLVTGGSIAYLAHVKFSSRPYSWAYVLGGFTLGYVGGAYLSKVLNK